MSKFKIGLGNHFKQEIATILTKVITQDIKDYATLNDLLVKNGIHFYTWDKIYTSLLKGDVESAISIRAKRGPWVFVTLFDPISKTLISIVKDKNLEEIMNKYGKNGSPHYMHALVTYNPSVEELVGFSANRVYQSELLPLIKDEEWLEKLNEIKKEVLGEYFNKIESHVVVSFEHKKGEVTLLKCTMLSKEMEIILEENWSEFIIPVYPDVLLEIYDEEPADDDNTKIVQLLDNKVIKKKLQKKDNVVELRKRKDRKNDSSSD